MSTTQCNDLKDKSDEPALIKQLWPYLLMLGFDKRHSSPLCVEKVIASTQSSTPIVIRVEYASRDSVCITVRSPVGQFTSHTTTMKQDAIDHVKRRIKQWQK